MKARFALIALVLAALIGGYLWHSRQPDQQAARTVDRFIEALEYQSSNLRSRDDVHEVIRETVATKLKLQVTDPPSGFTLPEALSHESLCAKADQFHTFTSKREFKTVEESVEVIGDRAQVTRVEEITAAILGNRGTETWQLTFDLKRGEDWKITGIRAKKSE